MASIEILSVNISLKKGTPKTPVAGAELDHLGVQGDAHAGAWHRQVSLLGVESFEKMAAVSGKKPNFGDFAENLTTRGFRLYDMHPLDRLVSDNLELEVTQIGKKCHGKECAIFRQSGDCVMPREGVFCRVIRGGLVQPGDRLQYQPKVIRIAIITLSDRAYAGEYDDLSAPLLKQLAEEHFASAGRLCAIQTLILPDDPGRLQEQVREFLSAGADIIFTTGGTGIGARDITTDVIKPMLSKEIPGITEMIRMKYGMQFPEALLSRSVAGVIDRTLIYTLPGSPKAVREYAGEIFRTLQHALLMLAAIDSHE